ncbi:phospho-N-acetylmuramoyl-pentapeptide-transferase [Clostridia bacterium]|nr:phospho-N-acetylmuramoyl-pentapeptide-transferase [Clostridia bacterium]
MGDMLISAGVSCVLTVIIGLWLIPFLRKVKFGQTILDIGPAWHKSKQGTPTMGGFMFMAAITVAAVALGWRSMLEGNYVHLFVLLFGWLFGLIGFVDDYNKVKKKQNKGLSALQKLALQAAVAVAFMSLLRFQGFLTPDVYMIIKGWTVSLDWVLFLIIGILLVCGMVNAVNLTDGVDGLCSGVTLPVAVFFAALAHAWAMPQIAVLAAALAGGMVGFLCYNHHPAKVFMGDTGSLFLGGMICGLSFAMDAPILMIIVGIIYIIEMFSVILQVGYFKLTHGKRLFKMAPIHHHFEKSGWSEVKVTAVFMTITSVICVLTYLGVAGR